MLETKVSDFYYLRETKKSKVACIGIATFLLKHHLYKRYLQFMSSSKVMDAYHSAPTVGLPMA